MNSGSNSKFILVSTANLLFVVHLVLVCIVTVGWLIPGFFYIHLSLLLATLLSEIIFGYCVLTSLEFGIRKKLDPNLVFDKSCMVHYIRKWRGLGPRPNIANKASFFKRNSFVFTLIFLGAISFFFNFYIKA